MEGGSDQPAASATKAPGPTREDGTTREADSASAAEPTAAATAAPAGMLYCNPAAGLLEVVDPADGGAA